MRWRARKPRRSRTSKPARSRRKRMRFVPEFDPDAAAAAGSGLYGLTCTPEQSRFVVVPVPFEATTSYGGGTSRAPAAILRASRQVDLHDRQTGRPFEDGIARLNIPRRIETLN